LSLPFGRPRNRAEVLEHPEYYELRGSLVQFLEDESHPSPADEAKESQAEAVAS